MRVSPSAKAASTASTGYSSIMLGARSGGTSTPRSALASHAKVGRPARRLQARRSSSSMSAPISRNVSMKPAARRVHQHAFEHDVGARRRSGGGDGEGGGARIAGNGDGAPMQLGIAADGDGAACRPPRPSTEISAPKWLSMRSVWSRVGIGSITVVRPGACRPASSTADFTCADGDRQRRRRWGRGRACRVTVSGKVVRSSSPVGRAPCAAAASSTRPWAGGRARHRR